MPISDNVGDREHDKFVESVAVPGKPVLAVTNPDGSNIGGSGGTSMLDDSAFTPGGSSVTPAGFLADDVAPDPVNEGDIGAPRMRATTRAAYVEPVDQSGDSMGDDANNALRVNVVAGGAGDGAIQDGVTPTIEATVMDTPTAAPAGTDNPLLVSLNGTTLPALSAGAANIGDVDVASLPADIDIRNLVPAQDEVQARAKAQFDDVAPTLPAEDGYADLRITGQRDLRVNLRNNAGAELGTTGNPVRTDPTGTTTQPVSGTVTANQGGAPWGVNPTAETAGVGVGAAADAEASGVGSVIAVLKRLRTLLAAGLPAALVGGRLDVNIGAVGPNVPVNTAAGQEVATRQTVLDPLNDAGTAVPIKFVRVNATADGDNTIVAAVGGKKIRVLGYALTVTAAGTITVQNTQATPVLMAQFSLAAQGGVSYAGGLTAPAFETAVGTGVEINNPAGVDILGHLTYVEV